MTDDLAHQDADGRILIVEDHTLLAQALVLGLRVAAPGLDCHVARLDGPDGVLRQAADLDPDLVLLDLDLGGLDGVELVRGLRATGARVLVVTGCRDEPRLAATLALGTEGWVNKNEPFERLIDTVVETMAGRTLMSPRRRVELVDLGRRHLASLGEIRARMDRLTRREHEILSAIERGKSAQEIASELFLSLATARSHIHSILRKLEVSSQLAAVAVARRARVQEDPRSPISA